MPQDTDGPRASHTLYRVMGEGEKANWIQIGQAWRDPDNKGFSLVLDAVPLNGLVRMRAAGD